MPRFVSPSLHAVLDYALDLALLGVPAVLGFTGVALWLPVAIGLLNAAYSLLTAYPGGVVRRLPLRTHLAVDLALGGVFVAAGLLPGLLLAARVFLVGAGLGIAAAVAVTDPGPASG